MKVRSFVYYDTKDDKKVLFNDVVEKFKDQLFQSGLRVKDLEEIRYYYNAAENTFYIVAITKYNFEMNYKIVLEDI